MKLLRHAAPLLALALALGARVSLAADPAAPLRARLERAVQAGEIPGGVVSVVHRGAVVFDEAFGFRELDGRRPLGRDAVFFIASSTKPISTTAILTLVRDGKLALTTPVSRWFPELARARTDDGRAVPGPEIRHLLAHMAGFFSNEEARTTPALASFAVENDTAEQDYRAWVARMVQVPLRSAPGERWAYGAQGLMTAGRIAELITSRTIDELIAERVFRPLGMRETSFRVSPVAAERHAVAYSRKQGKLERLAGQPPADPKFILVSGGLHSTARDLREFLLLHLAEGAGPSARILPRALARDMRREQTGGAYRAAQRAARYEGYGLGWHVAEFDTEGVGRIFAHGGALGSLLWCDAAAQTGVVFLVQMPGAEVAALQREVVDLVRQAWDHADGTGSR